MSASLARITRLHQDAVEAANGVEVYVIGAEAISFQLTGLDSDTVTFQGTIDGTNWVSISCRRNDTTTDADTATADGIYFVLQPNFSKVRADLTTWSAGQVTIDVLVR